MKLAYVCGDPGVPVFGRKGCSIHVQEVLRALRGLGVDVEVFAVRLGGSPPADLAEMPVHRLPVLEAEGGPGREIALRAAEAGWPGILAAAGRFDAVYERYSLWSCSILEWARDRGLPALLEVNAPLIEEQAAHRELADPAGARWSAERVFGAATVLLAVSEEVAGYLGGFVEAVGRVEVLPNGVDAHRFAPALSRRRLRSDRESGVTIGFVGTLKPWHGTSLLLDALAQLREVHEGVQLLVVGDGPERPALEARVVELGLTRCTRFIGSVDAEEVPDWLGSMDVAVAPYPRLGSFYFSPLKVYEYMAAGLPVVASRIGQLKRVIDPGVTGLLVEPGDSGSLAEALGLLVADRALRERLGWAARAVVEERHTWSAVAERILHWAENGRRPVIPATLRSGSSGMREVA
jgi:glycosyltransferase involved in cell wall biosynthesis